MHGGGFYHPQKYLVAPPRLPERLHWFDWESYSTWLTGFALFTVLYLFNARTFLIDPRVHDWTPAAAIAAALAFLRRVLVRLRRDLPRVRTDAQHGDLIVGAGVFALHRLRFLARLPSVRRPRRVPARRRDDGDGDERQRRSSGSSPASARWSPQLRAGEPVDPIHGWRAKQRSVHNTYFTLPVVVTMLSNHYGWLVDGERNWLVLVAADAGRRADPRTSFVAPPQGGGRGAARRRGSYAIVGDAGDRRRSWSWLAPARRASAAAQTARRRVAPAASPRCEAIVDAALRDLPRRRGPAEGRLACRPPELVKQHAQQVYQQAVVLKLMPFNNATQMTDDERVLVKRWYEAGAPVQ